MLQLISEDTSAVCILLLALDSYLVRMEKGSDRISAAFMSVKRKLRKFRWNTVIFNLSKDELIQSPTDTVVTMDQVKQIKLETHPQEAFTTHLRMDEDSCVNGSEIKVSPNDYSINVVVIKARHTPIFFSVVSMFTIDKKITIQEEKIDPDDVATSPLHEQTEGKSELFSWITPTDYFAQELLHSDVVCGNDEEIEFVADPFMSIKNTSDTEQVASSDEHTDSDKISSNEDICRPHSSKTNDYSENEVDINEVGEDYQCPKSFSSGDNKVTMVVGEESFELPEEIVTGVQSSGKWVDVTGLEDSCTDCDHFGKNKDVVLQEATCSSSEDLQDLTN